MKNKILVFCLLFIILVITVRLFIGEPCHVPSPSMEPTILTGDWLWLDKASYGGKLPKRFADIPILNIFTWIPMLRDLDKNLDWGDHRFWGVSEPSLGDVVVFYNPQNEDQLYVKRIASIINRGDSIMADSCNYVLIEEIAKKDNKTVKITDDGILINNHLIQHYKSEHDYYFMKGDNEKNSLDSRDYGYIKKEKIIGKINTILFSTFKDEEDGWTYFREGRFCISLDQSTK